MPNRVGMLYSLPNSHFGSSLGHRLRKGQVFESFRSKNLAFFELKHPRSPCHSWVSVLYGQPGLNFSR